MISSYESIPTEIIQLIQNEQAWHYKIIPFQFQDNVIKLLISSDHNGLDAQKEVGIVLGYSVIFIEYSPEVITQLLSKYYRRGKEGTRKIQTFNQDNENFISFLIIEASEMGCSDIHFEALEEKCRIRFRIDGKLIEKYILNKSKYQAMINKVKISANLDIAEKRLPQDGRIKFEEGTNKFDIRVSILPSLYGEKIVLRLLSKDATNLNLKHLGLSEKQYLDYDSGIKRPHGIVLISGPTGSGKTTTLYASLKELNKPDVNILTIEDPIEYTLEGITQVQLNEKIGLTFAGTLRSFLRQDPDIIMIGEIRDQETAQMAVRAALTGHLVFSTIHTNSALGILSRLTDMGIPEFLIRNTLNLAVAQRLVRLLCPECKRVNSQVPEFLENKEGHHILKLYEPQGCVKCHFTGYKGRKAVYEVIPIRENTLNEVFSKKVSEDVFFAENKIESLQISCLSLLESGQTSLNEIYPYIH